MAQNGNHVEGVGAQHKVPDGIVLPPKDIRAIVEKTAGYVARNGPVFEDRIRDKESANPKFSFLTPNDAYAPFYQWRLEEVRAGRNLDPSGKSASASAAPAKPKGPEPPPEFEFSARMPNISAQDLDVLRLTALFVARKGKSWMTTLSQREARNFQFDFLRPQHSLYSFFQRMVDQYTMLLTTGPEGQKAEQARIRLLQDNIQDRFRVLNLAKKRAEYVKYQETQKQKKEEAEEAERIAYAQIDWHDFVVVETVVFTDADEQTELQPPTTLNELQSTSLEQKAQMSLARPEMRIEEAMPDSDMAAYATYQDNYDIPQNGYNPQQPQMPYYPQPDPYNTQPPHPQYPYNPAPPQAAATPPPQTTTAPHPSQTQPPPMRIRQDYVPRAQQRTQAQSQSSLCPNCGQRIPNAELEQHLRIELLDPSWKEQQNKAAERYSQATVGAVDVAANLKRLRAKADGIGSSDVMAEAAAKVLDEEEERRKRQRVDGLTDSPNVPGGKGQNKGLSVEEQLRNIRSRYAQ